MNVRPSPSSVAVDDSGLTGRHLQFVREYLKDRNATQAALRAGYSPKSAAEMGHQLLRNSNIARLVRQIEIELMRQTEIDEVWVITHLKNNAARGMELDDLSAVNRSLELIGKHIGMFVERKDINLTFDQIEALEVTVVDPMIIDDVDYSVEEKPRKGKK